ncbi:hypothetical protein Tco_1228968, partial [Tanacetum coccineum]
MSQIDRMDSTNAKCCHALLVFDKWRCDDLALQPSQAAIEEQTTVIHVIPTKVRVYKDTDDDPESDVHGVWVNHNLHSHSSSSTSVNTERVAQPTPSSSTNHRILTQYKEKRSRVRDTGTGVNTGRRNVVRKANLNRIDANHVSLLAGNNGEGSSSTHNAGKYVRSGCTTALNVVPWETDGESCLSSASTLFVLNCSCLNTYLDDIDVDLKFVEEQRLNLFSKYINLALELSTCRDELLELKQAKI